ncbi:protein kinase domain-containing protein [Funiculus sociatus]|uniref:protein kinase domain-containing protein n=1 Tax=Funiculus sociatus TaxID=450527 RepID=UPI0016836494|nr:YARHG domain-containing protein [Trichocoleus sp. FACHB-69]MBD1934784.1 YARHG domain-containing protein [Trichocoleus sp. FACHB-69]
MAFTYFCQAVRTPTLLNNRYRIIQTLGSGGFGDTFLAEDTQMPSQRRCVIKQLKPITNNPQIYQLVQQRFQREAAILEELGEENPQIPRLYAYLESDEQFYLVQEWIQGETLRAKVKHLGVMSESAVKEILISLLPVLDFVHSKRMIHRDIKPDNIILRLRDGKPVLIDFGAVRETMSTVLNSHGSTTSSIVIGTPGYMPPEQAAGRPVYSSDLYSLGFTALYLLTGNTPQQLETDPQTGDILWRSDAVSVSSSLAAVLDKAIQSHPRDRFPTAKAMLDALQSGTISQVSNFSHADTTVMPSGQLFSKPTETLPQPNSGRSRWLTGVRDKPEKFWIGSLIFGCLIGLFILLGFFLSKPSPPLVEGFLGKQTNKFDDFPWLSQRPVTDADLRGKNAYELDIMRNSIYARHGRKFLNKDLQDYFNRQPWYRPKYNPEEFPDRLLSPLEERNVIYILAYQKRYGLRWFP